MKPVEFISAGAGSGKTYRLTQVLANALESGAARPHAVLATTFTVKAATELRQRARRWLLESGRLDLATAVGQARLGTVNSVCGQLLKRFCFEIGLSPDQTVLSEAQVKHLTASALDETLSGESRVELMTLTRRFGIEDDEWSTPVRDVVKAARENGILAVGLGPMGQRNADVLLSNWPQPEQGVDHTATLAAVVTAAVTGIDDAIQAATAKGEKVAQKTRDELDSLRNIGRALGDGSWTWPNWLSACKVDAGAKLRDTVKPVATAAQAHERHPQFHADVRRYLDLVFQLAADALETFAQAKRELGAVDFVDQEVLLLRALHESEEVRSAIASELDLVLVDEFQDTSPLQLALFVELAKLAKQSVWVGDPKQAIYGFRGTDATLIARIIDSIEGWGGKIGEALTTSRRSTPALVSLTNAVFVPAFSPDIQPDAVLLHPSRTNIADQPSLYDWTFESPRVDCDYLGLGPAVAELLAAGSRVEDKDAKTLRPTEPGDVAVLCRRNKDVELAVAALARWGIPSASSRPGLLATPEALLVTACLRRLQDPTDTVATALIVSLSDGVAPEMWLADRLNHLATDAPVSHWKAIGPGAHPLVARLETLRPALMALTPCEALRLAKSESQVAMRASQWSLNPQQARVRIANVEALIAMGKTYEDGCVSAKRPATVDGLIRWLAAQASAGDDERAAAVGGAVEVLTHHGAKGLEWPVVVLTGLGRTSRSALWQVRARTEGDFDPLNPLRNRFIHFWPKPYGKHSAPQAAANAEGSAIGLAMQKEARDEGKRLLYVSMTRARDALVLVSTKKKLPARAWVEEVGAANLLFGPAGAVPLPDGASIDRQTKEWTADDCAVEPLAITPSERCWFGAAEPRESNPLWVRPSAAEGGRFSATAVETVGTRIAITTAVDMAALGSALHLCIAHSGTNRTLDAAGIQRVLTKWGVEQAVQAGAVLGQVVALRTWLESRWPGAPVLSEVPIEVDLPDGRRLRGQIDLLVDSPGGWVLLDHKADPRSAANDHRVAQLHGPQLSAYALALARATGRPVLEQWLFMPVAAQAVRVGDEFVVPAVA